MSNFNTNVSTERENNNMQLAEAQSAIGTPIILYGGAGIGKSTLASLAPRPIFLDVENGLRRIPNVPRTPVIKTWEQFQTACMEFLKSDYKTAIIDTIDVLEQILHQHLCKQNNWKSIESAGYGKGYNMAQENWVKFCEYTDVVCAANKNLILVAHEFIRPYAAPDCDAYDRFNIKINKNSANILIAKVDAVLFAQFEVIVRDDKTKEDRVRGVSTGKRVLRATENAAWVAKNRFNLSPTVDFDASVFDKLLFAK